MAEYIEKHKVVNLLTALENECQQFKPFEGFEHAMYRKLCETEIAIGKLPTADVVPVVRCKDCKYAYINGFSAASGVALCSSNAKVMQQDDFCSYGERKDGGAE